MSEYSECACACAKEQERKREIDIKRERERESKKHTHTHTHTFIHSHTHSLVYAVNNIAYGHSILRFETICGESDVCERCTDGHE